MPEPEPVPPAVSIPPRDQGLEGMRKQLAALDAQHEQMIGELSSLARNLIIVSFQVVLVGGMIVLLARQLDSIEFPRTIEVPVK